MSQFKTVNPTLGKKPAIASVIPAKQFVPWMGFVGFSFTLAEIFALSNIVTASIVFGLCLGYWMLTGDKEWLFLGKFIATPRLVRGYKQPQKLLKGERQ